MSWDGNVLRRRLLFCLAVPPPCQGYHLSHLVKPLQPHSNTFMVTPLLINIIFIELSDAKPSERIHGGPGFRTWIDLFRAGFTLEEILGWGRIKYLALTFVVIGGH